MKKTIGWLVVSVFLVISCAACRRSVSFKNPARITSDHVEVKKTRAALAVVVTQLTRGEEVDVLSRESHWLRIRTKSGKVGWIEESAAMNQSIIDAENALARETQNEIIQADGEASTTTNLHIRPGRDTPVFQRLTKGDKIQIYDRTLTDRPTLPGGPPPSSQSTSMHKDPWLKVRTGNGIVGWAYSPSINFDVPDEIAEYAESRRIIAWLVLNQVQSEDGKKINQYVVADVESGIAPEYDFDRIRVFTWNLKRHRYETAFRLSKILGVYPIRVFNVDNNPAFEFSRLEGPDEDAPKIKEQYVMRGVLVRKMDHSAQPAPAPRSRRR